MALHYLPVRLIRLLKMVAVFAPLVLSLSLLVLLIDAAAHVSRQKRDRLARDAIRSHLEKASFCDNWAASPSNLSEANATVIELCQQIQDAQRAFFSRRPNKVNTFNHSIIRKSESVCTENTFMVVLVHSLHSYRERRDAIRQTWGGAARNRKWPGREPWPANLEVKLVFVFGKNADRVMESRLEEESRTHGDIVQGDFVESYKNMTLKSLLGLKWVAEYCPSVKYLFKCDDDMFVNLLAIMKILRTSPMSWSIMGPLNVGSRVYRAGKWRITKDEYPFFYFPPYESGSGYAISSDLVQPLLETSDFVPWIFIDDVYVTGILGKILEVGHVTQRGFAYWTSKAPSVCQIEDGSVLTGTKVTPQLQVDLWKQLEEGGRCQSASNDTEKVHTDSTDLRSTLKATA